MACRRVEQDLRASNLLAPRREGGLASLWSYSGPRGLTHSPSQKRLSCIAIFGLYRFTLVATPS